MFRGAGGFDGNVSAWYVSAKRDVFGMFEWAINFDRDLGSWSISLGEASTFDKDLANWNVGRVTNIEAMFNGASTFDGDMSTSNVEAATDTAKMFHRTNNFDGDVSNWVLSGVTERRVARPIVRFHVRGLHELRLGLDDVGRVGNHGRVRDVP